MISLKRVLFSSFALTAVILTAASFTSAQRLQVPQVSQKASVMQRIGLSDISITYSRPAVKGRKVYGDWPTPVAGEATLDNQNVRPKDARSFLGDMSGGPVLTRRPFLLPMTMS